MSSLSSVGSGGGSPMPGSVLTLTGNSGGAVGPDGGGNINVVGDGSIISIAGNPGTNTLTATIATATTAQEGATTLATNAQAIAGTDAVNAVTSAALGAKLGTQTAHAVAIAEGTASALHWSNVGSNGQVLIGATAADPAFATLTSTGGTILFTTGANSLNLEAAGAGAGVTVNADVGSATPAAGILTLKGLAGGNIATAGAANNLTVAVSGTTNHAVQIGNATGSLTSVAVGATNTVLLGNTGADPSFGAVPNGALAHSSITVTGDNNITIGGSPVSLGGTLTITSPPFVQYDLVTSGAGSALQSLPAGVGSAGQVLMSNGAGLYPTWGTPTSSSSIVTTFTSSGTFTKNVNSKFISMIIINGGSGGGSGSCGNSTIAGGGGGGAAGSVVQAFIPAAYLAASTSVVIGAAGSGGASVNTAIPTVGNNGTAGGISSVGLITPIANIAAPYGQGGQLAAQASGGQGGQYTGAFSFNTSGANSLVVGGGRGNPGAGETVNNSLGIFVCTSGAGGAGADSGTARQGGAVNATNFNSITAATTSAGGIETGTVNGADGVGITTGTGFTIFGMGGGGGGGMKSIGAGHGGAGGGVGAGGGGGGGSLLNNPSGAGGAGAPGYVYIIEYL